MRLLWSPLALSRVEEIVDFIAQDKLGAAQAWAEAVFDLVETLPATPKRGRRVPELNREEIRELIHESYRIIYRLETRAVWILTIRHGRRPLDPSEIDPPGS